MKNFKVGKFRIRIETDNERKEIARKAREVKEEKTQEKFRAGLETLLEKGEKITAYKVAKETGISYNTARKYLEIMKDKQAMHKVKRIIKKEIKN